MRLARVTRDEQAAQAARTIEDDPRREPSPRPGGRRRRSGVWPRRATLMPEAFSAVGYMQARPRKSTAASSIVLIGKDGSTLAYLDIPPGLDIEPLVAHRVGVRGDPHFNEELGSRLITVRDLETIESRR